MTGSDTGPAMASLTSADGLAGAIADLGLATRGGVLVLVGGADGLDRQALEKIEPLFSHALVPFARERAVVVVDGGTDSGVMRLMGRARLDAAASFPLFGVVVAELADELEPNHTHFLLVGGSRWGDESPWIAAVAGAIAHDSPQVTVLVDGGDIAWTDAEQSVASGRPVVVVDGTGRAADALASAARGEAADERAARLAASGLVTVVPAEPAKLRRAIESAFGSAR